MLRLPAALALEASVGDPEPTWHQVARLPPLAAQLIEHQGHTRICPRCGTINQAAIPADVRLHSVGPRLAAFMAYLRGCHHVSLRGVEDIVETAFETPVSLGQVSNLETQMSAVLASAHAEALQAVRQAPVKNADETSWKQAGKLCWLWLAATQSVAAFVVHTRRGWQACTPCWGRWCKASSARIAGRSTVAWPWASDRFAGRICGVIFSGCPSVAARQGVGWARSARPRLTSCSTGGRHTAVGPSAGRKWCRSWSRCVRSFAGTRRMAARRDAKVVALCVNLLAVEAVLWTFLDGEGVEPTNNHAERMVRRGVLWRKCAYGSWSEEGCRFVERMLTVVQTLRLQKRPVLHYLVAAIQAHRTNLPTPSLLSNQ